VSPPILPVNRFFQRYVAFVRQPDVARLLFVALLARMPVGMVGFAMLMFLREALGNFALAGSAVGIHFISMAAAAPVIGRIVDRRGPRKLLLVTGVIQPLALLAILACAHLRLPFTAIAACAVVAGAFATPITTLTRASWRYRFESEEDRRTAFALDSVMIEINFTLGPAIVAGILATLGATMGFGFAIAVVVVAFLIFFASPALGYFKRSDPVERSLLGPLAEPRLLLLFTATFGNALCYGLLEVGYPAYGTSLGLPALAGILLAVNSLGSAIGGALFGGLPFKAPVERQFACVMALMALPVFLHAFVSAPLAFGVVAFFAGALIAPSIASQSVLVSRLAPARYATEAFTWSSTFIVSGLGAGMALGGFLAETYGLRSIFATGGAVMGTMAVVALLVTAPRAGKPARAAR
jgi:MFS family permease